MNLTRRFFFGGLIAAPAVIAVNHLMPIKLIDWTPVNDYTGIKKIINDTLSQYINDALSQYMFEPNDALTRIKIRDTINNQLVNMHMRDNLYDYHVVCNSFNIL